MGFVRITHKDVGDGVVHESAIDLYAELGWTCPNPGDVRDLPSAFEGDVTAVAPATADAPPTPAQPARSASKADWVTYVADVLGGDREAAETMTRDELVARYATKES